MDIKLSPRHSRRAFLQQVKPCSLAVAFSKRESSRQAEIIDFSPGQSANQRNVWGNTLVLGEEADSTALLSFLADEICNLSSELHSHSAQEGATETVFHDTVTASGKTTHIAKDIEGRICAVRYRHGDSLFLQYDGKGAIYAFSQTRADGTIRRKGQKRFDGMIVTDGTGEVVAKGQLITIDQEGQLYIHTSDRRYFALDLLADLNAISRNPGKDAARKNFVSASFARSRFKMTRVSAPDRAEERRSTFAYRLESRYDTQTLSTWLRSRQAHAAWKSVRDYLSQTGI